MSSDIINQSAGLEALFWKVLIIFLGVAALVMPVFVISMYGVLKRIEKEAKEMRVRLQEIVYQQGKGKSL